MYSPWGHEESDTGEQLHFTSLVFYAGVADTLWINPHDRNPSWSACLADAPRIGHIHHHLSRLQPAQPLPTAFGPALVARALQMPRRTGHEAAFVQAVSELPTAEIRTLLLVFVN